ncbi:tetratricopeptide repeat protein [Desulfovibrio litoralis]|uniref:Uncharacterized protein n=1 Tax=Desulfovibrio litoralis DSM 11393 TaxID=1121455 RepID=A0A1M7RZU8_9BACT|nr:hypothetical protein [Desulfovibrio litoralis]SHN51696.1 hypothetical protein SAMN02745728_00374 [Desulfovibrio litoralis DSM 11393]
MSEPNKKSKNGELTATAPIEQTNTTERTLLDAIRTETAPEATPFFMFFVNNAKLLIGILSVFIIILVGVGIFEYTAKNALEKSQQELRLILQKADDTEKAKQLESFINTAPAGVLLHANLALAQAYENLQDYQKATNAWQKVSQLSDAPMKYQAIIGEASDLSAIGEHKKALELIEKSLTTLNNQDSPYQIALKALLADIAERSGDKELAIKTLQGLLDSGKIQDTYYFKRRIELLQKK